RAQTRRGELGLREREPTAAAADADQHNATAVSRAARTRMHRGAAPGRMLSAPATAADVPSASRASALVLAETEQVSHRLSIDHPVGRHGCLLHAQRRLVPELCED